MKVNVRECSWGNRCRTLCTYTIFWHREAEFEYLQAEYLQMLFFSHKTHIRCISTTMFLHVLRYHPNALNRNKLSYPLIRPSSPFCLYIHHSLEVCALVKTCQRFSPHDIIPQFLLLEKEQTFYSPLSSTLWWVIDPKKDRFWLSTIPTAPRKVSPSVKEGFSLWTVNDSRINPPPALW